MATDSNPYAPPQAHVADVLAPGVAHPIKLWSWKGRIGRIRYLAYNAAAYFCIFIPFNLLLGIFVGIAARGQSDLNLDWVPLIGVVPAAIIFSIFSTLQLIKRCHDLGLTGWFSLVSLLPVINVIFFLVVIFKAGQKDSNEYGPPPPSNRWFHWVLGLVFPIVVVGLLAAIAIPTYQEYVARARAAQVK